MSNRLSGLFGLAILLVGGAGIYLLSRSGPGIEAEPEETVQTVVPVETAQIRRMTLHDYLWAYGSVVPNPGTADAAPASVQITSPLDGIVTEIHCAVGQHVEKGQILFALYDRVAKLGVDQAEKTLAFTQENFDRQDKLRQIQGTSAKLYLEAKQQLDNARNELNRAQAELELLKVTAPLDGTIMDIRARTGEAVTQTSVLAQLTDLTQLVVKAGVPSSEAHRLQLGQRTEIDGGTSAASSDRQAHALVGKLDYIDRRIDPDNDTVAVLVGLSAGDGLRLGQFVRIKILVEERDSRLAVPRESVVTTPEGQTVLAVVQGDEAVPTPVKRGISEEGWTEVEGQGLEPGMSVVTTGAYGLPGRTKIRMVGQ
jgi:membrane fusion protein (multidrug efflux system)